MAKYVGSVCIVGPMQYGPGDAIAVWIRQTTTYWWLLMDGLTVSSIKKTRCIACGTTD